MKRETIVSKLGLNLDERRLGYHLTNNPNQLMADGPKSVTIHDTANKTPGADADNHHTYLRNSSWGAKVSWHYTVDEKVAIQHFRDDRITWHSGTRQGNNTSIGIEMAVDADRKGDVMMGPANYKTMLDNTAKLTAMLLIENDLTIKDVKQHFDWSGKNCPAELRRGTYGLEWSDFLDMVQNYLDTVLEPQETHTDEDEAPEGKLFNVRLGAFKKRANAEELLKKAKAVGINAYLVLIDDPREGGK